MALTYQESVEQTITAGEQIHQIVNGTATTEVTVEDGSKIPSIRKALVDNFYFKDPISWQAGQQETVFNQLRKFTDGTLWYAPSASASAPVLMGTTPLGSNVWRIYSPDTLVKLTPQIRELIKRSYAEAGYNLVTGSFETGGTLSLVNDVLLYESEGIAYSWGGSLPKIVTSDSTPTSSGGISPSAWVSRSEDLLTSKVVGLFNNVQDMSDGLLSVGKLYQTSGFYTSNDGGSALYLGYPAGTLANGYGAIGTSNGVVAVITPFNGVVTDVQFGVRKVYTQAELSSTPDSTAAMQAFLDYVRKNHIEGRMAGGASAFDGTLYYDPDAFQQSSRIVGAGSSALVLTTNLYNSTVLYKRTPGDLIRLNCVRGTTNKKQNNGLQRLSFGGFTIMGSAEATPGAGNGVTGIFARTTRHSHFFEISFYQVDRWMEGFTAGDYYDYNIFDFIRGKDTYRSGLRMRQCDDGYYHVLVDSVDKWAPADVEDAIVRLDGGYSMNAHLIVGNPTPIVDNVGYMFKRVFSITNAKSPVVKLHNELLGWGLTGVFFGDCANPLVTGYSRESVITLYNTKNIITQNWTSAIIDQVNKRHFYVFNTTGAGNTVEPIVYIGDGCSCVDYTEETHDPNQVDLNFNMICQSATFGKLKRGYVILENSHIRKDGPSNVFAQTKNTVTYTASVPNGSTTLGQISVPNVTSAGCIEVDVLTYGPGALTAVLSKVVFTYTRASNSSVNVNSTVTVSGTIGTHTVVISVNKLITSPTGTEVWNITAANSGGATYQAAVTNRSGLSIGSSPAVVT